MIVTIRDDDAYAFVKTSLYSPMQLFSIYCFDGSKIILSSLTGYQLEYIDKSIVEISKCVAHFTSQYEIENKYTNSISHAIDTIHNNSETNTHKRTAISVRKSETICVGTRNCPLLLHPPK